MNHPEVEAIPALSERNWLAKLYYYHGFYCASHPGIVILICAVLILLCSAPIVSFSPFGATIPSEWNETIPNDTSNSDKPVWVKDKPVAYIQQVIVAVSVEPVNASFLIPHIVQEAFQPAFKIVDHLYKHKHQERSEDKSTKITDLCLAIRHRDPFLFSGGGQVLPQKGCLQISPANLWEDASSFQKEVDVMAKLYGKPIKNSFSMKENIFGVPLREVGLFPLNIEKECLVIRYAVTAVLHDYNPSYIKGLKKLLEEKFPHVVKTKGDNDMQTIVHIYYEGDNIIEIYHLCFTYFMVFIYLVFSVSKIEMVKSKLGLAFSAVVTVVASLSMAAGLCIFFGMVPSVSSSEIFPYLVIIIGLENILVITRSIVSTPAYLPVPLRVAEGLSREGRSITLNLTTELLLLLCGYFTFVPAVQEFCMVGGVGVLTDFFLQIVFFATVLSIDLSRLEPQTHCIKSPQVEINVYNQLSSGGLPDNEKIKHSPKTAGKDQSYTWNDVLVLLTSPRKIFAIRQDLPKRLNFAYFWARTRIVQRGCMVFALLYFVYVALSTLINKEEKITSNTAGDDHGYNNTLSNSNTSLTGSILLPTMITSGFHSEKNYLPNHNFEERSPRQRSNSTNVNWNRCNDNLNSEGLWRNLSRHHWPELLYLYGVNVIDRYISVLPPINVQYKIDALQFVNSMSPVSDSVSKFYKDFKESSPWTARSYTVKFELVDFVKVLYIFTGIFISVAIYMIYALLTTLPKRRRKKRQKAIVPKTSPVILDGHRQNIECIDCDNNVIASSCLEGSVRVWDCKTSECISVMKRNGRSSQVWSLKCWDSFVALGCSNGDVEIWDFTRESITFLYETDSCGVTTLRYTPERKVLLISRLNGVLEFLELGSSLLKPNGLLKNSKLCGVPPNPKKKDLSDHSTWEFITNNVRRDLYPCYSCRAHRKIISVLAICKDLVISGSHDHLLKVFRVQTGLCLFTLRGHTSAVTALYVDEPKLGAISGSFDGELRLWSLISGDSSRFSASHLCSIVAIVGTSNSIVSLDISELLCVWDRPTRNCLHSISQLPGGCLDLTLMSPNLAVCVGRGTMNILELTNGRILRQVDLEQKNDHVAMNHVISCGSNTVVCDYGERLVLLKFLEITEKLE